MEHEDGTKAERQRGTPQGGVISPILSNLFLHYTLDLWMTRTHPDLPWCRYADTGWFTAEASRKPRLSRSNFKRVWQSAAWSCIRQRPRSSTARTGVAEERIRTSNSTFSDIAFDRDGSGGPGTTHCSVASTQRSVPRR